MWIGVADGVGGWSQINVDSGIYSRLLMQTAKAAASIISPSPIAPQIVLEEAHKKTNVRVSIACEYCLCAHASLFTAAACYVAWHMCTWHADLRTYVYIYSALVEPLSNGVSYLNS